VLPTAMVFVLVLLSSQAPSSAGPVGVEVTGGGGAVAAVVAPTVRLVTALGTYPKEGKTIPWLAPCPQWAIAFTVLPGATANGAL
jgi:hypothetical protein